MTKLQGSEKQIKWAEDLREEILAQFEIGFAKVENKKDFIKEEYKMTVEMAKEILFNIEKASSIIENYKGFKADESMSWISIEELAEMIISRHGMEIAESNEELAEVADAFFNEDFEAVKEYFESKNEVSEEVEIEVIEVEFNGGELRDCSQGNYMIAEVDGIELYAETNEADDEKSYQILKEEIVSQAKENGIDIDRLKFWWD